MRIKKKPEESVYLLKITRGISTWIVCYCDGKVTVLMSGYIKYSNSVTAIKSAQLMTKLLGRKLLISERPVVVKIEYTDNERYVLENHKGQPYTGSSADGAMLSLIRHSPETIKVWAKQARKTIPCHEQ